MPQKTVVFAPVGIDRRFRISGDASDAGVLGSIDHHDGRYEDHVCRFLAATLRPGDVVADVGANIGALTVLMAALVGPTGRVHAFEPAPENVAHLRANLEANGLENVEVHETAVGDSTDPIDFSFDAAAPSGAHIGAAADGAAVRVPCTTLDAFVAATGVTRLDLVKVDVEGAEPMVLDGARRTYDTLRPTTIMECNPAPLRQVGSSSPADLLSRLDALHHHVSLLGDGGRALPLRSARHLERSLGRRGVVDLVGRPTPPTLLERAEAVVGDVGLRTRLNRTRLLVDRNYVVTPDVELDAPSALAGAATEQVTIEVRVRNRSRWWLSSDFPYVPVLIGCRWLRADGSLFEANGPRARFADPVPPGGSATVPVSVHLPFEPGSYVLQVTLVQETYAWLDEIDPSCRTLVPADVAPL